MEIGDILVEFSVFHSLNDLRAFSLYSLYKTEEVNYNISCGNLKMTISIAFGNIHFNPVILHSVFRVLSSAFGKV